MWLLWLELKNVPGNGLTFVISGWPAVASWVQNDTVVFAGHLGQMCTPDDLRSHCAVQGQFWA